MHFTDCINMYIAMVKSNFNSKYFNLAIFYPGFLNPLPSVIFEVLCANPLRMRFCAISSLTTERNFPNMRIREYTAGI